MDVYLYQGSCIYYLGFCLDKGGSNYQITKLPKGFRPRRQNVVFCVILAVNWCIIHVNYGNTESGQVTNETMSQHNCDTLSIHRYGPGPALLSPAGYPRPARLCSSLNCSKTVKNRQESSALSADLGSGVITVSMEEAPEPAQTQPTAEEPVKSIEDDTRGDGAAPASGVTDEQWRSMMDVVLAIYEVREEE